MIGNRGAKHRHDNLQSVSLYLTEFWLLVDSSLRGKDVFFASLVNDCPVPEEQVNDWLQRDLHHVDWTNKSKLTCNVRIGIFS